jgi:hypothetical protein
MSCGAVCGASSNAKRPTAQPVTRMQQTDVRAAFLRRSDPYGKRKRQANVRYVAFFL